MEIKLNLVEDYDVVLLFQILNNKKESHERANHEHVDMILLLEGNTNNERAMERLEAEKHCMRMNNEKIEFLNGLLNQLEPLVDKYFQDNHIGKYHQ